MKHLHQSWLILDALLGSTVPVISGYIARVIGDISSTMVIPIGKTSTAPPTWRTHSGLTPRKKLPNYLVVYFHCAVSILIENSWSFDDEFPDFSMKVGGFRQLYSAFLAHLAGCTSTRLATRLAMAGCFRFILCGVKCPGNE